MCRRAHAHCPHPEAPARVGDDIGDRQDVGALHRSRYRDQVGETGPALREHPRRTPAHNLVKQYACARILGGANDQSALVDPAAVPFDVRLEKQGGAVVRHRLDHNAHGVQEPLPPCRQRLADLGHVGQ